MDFSEILDSIPVKTEDDIKCRKFEIEDCERIHPLLTLTNPLTYMVFLDRRPDLPPDQVAVIHEIIKRLQANEALEYENAISQMVPVEESKEEETDNDSIKTVHTV